jgi:hypothetical protein
LVRIGCVAHELESFHLVLTLGVFMLMHLLLLALEGLCSSVELDELIAVCSFVSHVLELLSLILELEELLIVNIGGA